MDADVPFPSPLFSRVTRAQVVSRRTWLDDDTDSSSDSDSAVPASIPRRRSCLVQARMREEEVDYFQTPSVPIKSPLRRSSVNSTNHPKTVSSTPNPTAKYSDAPEPRNFSHPFSVDSQKHTPRDRFLDSTKSGTTTQRGPLSNRKPSTRPSPSRQGTRLPLHLQRCSSLETIVSVNTQRSARDTTPRGSYETAAASHSTSEEEYSSPTLYNLSVPQGSPSIRSSEGSTQPSNQASSPTRSTLRSPSSSSIIQRLKPKKFREPLVEPEHLEIARTVSLDQVSHRTSSSSSILTISSSRPSDIYPAASTSTSTSNRSQDSHDWKASDFDTSKLSEAELKKCKKKGINPALYAEMKAARKGKWMSPIGGNAVL
ncbi:hypothetical protein BU24DRAFT_452612 [Aaosphaeria arxii CBS 175.79]|uniref:Uncharacterized protein n=1 Tax=Aaosphaeria arxii CBS 175.79 TaxID=1450172 RepID=A0A6A5XLL3_9PLEO|nr:uncharacterized protein BU24DRAFT_452612 [Aaosphaeria arxii CBS 175.79]KAF2013786.1 hypothetical protein BU24DRAFT_452612 [Aaosphaeria arxii CBS 175.79]